MFSHRYIIKIYLGGQHRPLVEFSVIAQHIEIHGHSIRIDGITLDFNETHYIAVERVS
jgi:hypothetical protein